MKEGRGKNFFGVKEINGRKLHKTKSFRFISRNRVLLSSNCVRILEVVTCSSRCVQYIQWIVSFDHYARMRLRSLHEIVPVEL